VNVVPATGCGTPSSICGVLVAANAGEQAGTDTAI
jgi:hypothetical protein